jgi:uracil-DNA glycosylase
MSGPPVTGEAVSSPVMLIGQAPGFKEIEVHRPFAWTAGKTLFKWFEQIGVDEAAFRSQIYMSAVCRCFPGKNPGGGDRVPNKTEIQRCSLWLGTEFQLLKPQLIIPVGKLAIGRLLDFDKLTEVVGRKLDIELDGMQADVIPLPHPSGASTWHRTEPGRTLLNKALKLIRRHPAWQQATDTR